MQYLLINYYLPIMIYLLYLNVMTYPRYTPLIENLPSSVPFVGPESQERERNFLFEGRLGANENTTITLSHDSMIDGNPLPAGTYGLHMIPQEDEWTCLLYTSPSPRD